MILCDTNTLARSLTTHTSFPDEPLPLEADVLDQILPDRSADVQPSAISDLTTTGLGEYAREAQATYLLDRALQTINVTDTADRSDKLMLVDRDLRSFISSAMEEHIHQKAPFCGAIAIAIR